MAKKKVIVVQEAPPPPKQLWVVERTDDREKRIYVFADRWFDVRECGGMQLNTHGNYNLLFISAVMVDVHTGQAPIFEVVITGHAPNLERRFVQVTKEGTH